MQRRKFKASIPVLLASLLFIMNTPLDTLAASGTQIVTFPESLNQVQSKNITIPNLYAIDSVTTDTGNVNYTVSGEQVNITVSNGSWSSRTSYYDPYLYSKGVTDYSTGSSSSFPNSKSYNSGGYSGTLSSSGSSTVISGSYTPTDSKFISTTKSGNCRDGFMWHATGAGPGGWMDSMSGAWWLDSTTMTYNSGGYSGILSIAGNSECDAPYPTGTATEGDIAYTYGTMTASFSGTVVKPASDTRVWNQNYAGTVYQGGTAYKDYKYSYNVTVKYKYDQTAPTSTITKSTNAWTPSLVLTAKGFDTESGMFNIKRPNSTFVSGDTATYTVTKNGTYTFEFEDWVGNKSTKSITVDNIDDVPPFVWGSYLSPEEVTNQIVKIYVNGGDTLSGVKRIILPDGTYTTQPNAVYTVTTNGVYLFKIEDNAGLVYQYNVEVNNIDKTKPALSSLTLYQDLNGQYRVSVQATDNDEIEGVYLNSGASIPNNEKNGNYFISKLTSKPTYIQIKDRAGNNSGNINFLDLPTVTYPSDYNSGSISKGDVIVSANGSGALSYKMEYKDYNCASKPCSIKMEQNNSVNVINTSGNKTSISAFKIDNIDKTSVNLVLKGTRTGTAATTINLTWNKALTSGKATCETPEGTKTYNVIGTSYTITGKNFDYDCVVTGMHNAQTIKSNWVTLPTNFDKTVTFVKPSDAMPVKTFNAQVKIVAEKNVLGEFYILNTNSADASSQAVPIPNAIAQ